MAYALKETNSLFSGDHVMGWSTSIVAPPDGAMSDYMASLYKLAERSESLYFPGHGTSFATHRISCRAISVTGSGAKIDPAPARQGRSRYSDHGARDLYWYRSAAHRRGRPLGAGDLEDMVARGMVVTDGTPSIAGIYRLGD